MRLGIAWLALTVLLSTSARAGTSFGKSSSVTGNAKKSARSYVVRDETTLGEISLRLYGTCKRWPDIARWNRIREPYVIEPGQKLVLEEAPAVTPARGRRLLLQMWRRRLDSRALVVEEPVPPPAVALPKPAPIPVGVSEEEKRELEKEALEAAERSRRRLEAEEAERLHAERERKAREMEAEAERLRKAEAASRDESRRAALEAERKRIEAARLAEEARLAKEKAAREEMEKRRQAELLARVAKEAESKGEVEAPSSAEQLLSQAQAAFQAKRFEEAGELARRSRGMNPEPMVTWILEIRSWIGAGKLEEARAAARPFFEAHPEAKRFPFFKALGEI